MGHSKTPRFDCSSWVRHIPDLPQARKLHQIEDRGWLLCYVFGIRPTIEQSCSTCLLDKCFLLWRHFLSRWPRHLCWRQCSIDLAGSEHWGRFYCNSISAKIFIRCKSQRPRLEGAWEQASQRSLVCDCPDHARRYRLRCIWQLERSQPNCALEQQSHIRDPQPGWRDSRQQHPDGHFGKESTVLYVSIRSPAQGWYIVCVRFQGLPDLQRRYEHYRQGASGSPRRLPYIPEHWWECAAATF